MLENVFDISPVGLLTHSFLPEPGWAGVRLGLYVGPFQSGQESIPKVDQTCAQSVPKVDQNMFPKGAQKWRPKGTARQ